MSDDARALVEKRHREALERQQSEPQLSSERPAIHYTELPEANPDSPLYREWNTYRREVRRLLAEGHEGKFVLIKGEEIIGLFDTFDDGVRAGRAKYLFGAFMVKPIYEREPLLRLRGYSLPCRS